MIELLYVLDNILACKVSKICSEKKKKRDIRYFGKEKRNVLSAFHTHFLFYVLMVMYVLQ